jgi:hypothetical protein
MRVSEKVLTLSVLCLAFGPTPHARAAFELTRKEILPVEMEVKAVGPYLSSPYTAPRDRVWRRIVRHPTPTRSVRIEIRIRRADLSVPWRVIVQDLDGVEHDRIEGRPGMTGIFWTIEVPGQGAVLELWTDGAPGGLEIEVGRYACAVLKGIPLSITDGKDQRLEIVDDDVPESVRSWGTAVARLRFMTTLDDGSFVGSSCTGFLLSKNLLITNHHCIRGDLETQSAVVELGYDTYASAVERFRIASLEAPVAALDYSIVRLTGVPSERFRRALGVAANPSGNPLHFRMPAQPGPQFQPAPLGGTRDLAVIEHASGKPKQVSLENCRPDKVLVAGIAQVNGGDTDFSHTCDTLGGSSGSPVIDVLTGEIVGLHHLGAEQGVADPVNQAVHFSIILNDLETRNRGLYKEITETP